MGEKEKIKGWMYVIVSNPGQNEHLLGLHSKEQDVDFIPTFQSREAANDCLSTLPREKGQKYEVQAIHVDDLDETARKNGFLVAMVDSDGNIIK
ncbi:MAG: DUF3110 domain-containing protein [Desulfobulbaceae bacterium]|nr:MAG: DUF3110 domain-containing protein [Desulfobulbaceae bacterium]